MRCIWIHGIPGAGKTVLASHLIQTLKAHTKKREENDEASVTTVYAYYYCYFGHNQDEAASFLRWTISQLCRKADFVLTCLYHLYKGGGEPNLEELLSGLEVIL